MRREKDFEQLGINQQEIAMLANAATLGAINTGFHIIAFQNLVAPEELEGVRSIANVVTSTKRIEQYNWLVRLGKVREWIGPRVLNRFKAYGFTIENKKWEDSVEVEIDDITDDQLGQYVPQIQNMATEANQHYPRLITAILETGFLNEAYDGQPFFDESHPVGGRNITLVSNKGTLRLSHAGLTEAFENLHNLRDDRGEPLGIQYDTLFVHPSKRLLVQELIEAEYIIKGGTMQAYNRTRNIVPRVVYLPFLSDPEKWFLADTSKPIKPLILQIRERPIWQAVTNLNDSQVFDTDKFKFGLKMRHNAGYLLWQLAYGSDGSEVPAE